MSGIHTYRSWKDVSQPKVSQRCHMSRGGVTSFHNSPTVEVLTVHINVSAVVVRSGEVVQNGGVEIETPWKLSGVPANLLADQVKSLVCSKPCGAIRVDLWKQLLEQIVTLQDGAASIGLDVDDELGLASSFGGVEEGSVDDLEGHFVCLCRHEAIDTEHCNVIVAFALEEISGLLVISKVFVR